MVAAAFVPAAAPRLAVSRDGTHAVIADGRRAVTIRIADHAVICETPLVAGDVAFIGTTLRLLAVATGEHHTDVRLIDPQGAERIAEIRLDNPMRLAGANGAYALLLGTRTAAILTGGETSITPYQFLARTLPNVVGVAGTQFVAALPGTIEEWDPASRMPKRRLRLARVAAITSLGGSERVLWMTTQQDPHRLDVLPIVNRGQPKAHELPEPIAQVSGHPHTDAVICVGAETGRIYAIDLDGRTRIRTIAVPGIDRPDAAALVVHGGALAVIAAQVGRAIATAPIELARETEPVAAPLPPITRAKPIRFERAQDAPRSSLYDEADMSDLDAEPPRTVAETLRKQLAGSPPRTISEALRRPADPPDPDPPAPVARTITEALRARTAPPTGAAAPVAIGEAPSWPDELDASPRPSEPPAPPGEPIIARQPTTTAWSEGAGDLMAKLAALRANRDGSPDAPQRASWRDDAGTWARAVVSGTFDRAAPSCPPIETLATRFELPPQLIPALVLLYGSHLAGMLGAAPMDIARVLGRRWDDALGRGTLAELGLATHADSRVRLAPAIQRVLDELPPSGTLLGEPGSVSLLGPLVVVSRDPLRVIAERAVAQLGGAALYGDAAELALEARALGALAIGPSPAGVPRHPMLIVVADDRAAEQIDLPRFELAPAARHHAT